MWNDEKMLVDYIENLEQQKEEGNQYLQDLVTPEVNKLRDDANVGAMQKCVNEDLVFRCGVDTASAQFFVF